MSEQDTRKTINEIRASFGASPTMMTDEQIEAGREVYGAKLDYDMAVFDEVQEYRVIDYTTQDVGNVDPYDLATREQDSREKLEAEASELVADYAASGEVCDPMYNGIIELLDRQVAITERELCARCTPYATTKDYLDTIDKLTAERDQLDRDLTAEHALVSQFEYDNEQLREAIDAMENAQFYAMYKAKCEECEEAVSFAKRVENAVKAGQPVTLFGVDYEKQNKKLLAEHERFLKKLKRLRRRLAKAKKERDYLQKVVKTQAESFKKLECELAGKDG